MIIKLTDRQVEVLESIEKGDVYWRMIFIGIPARPTPRIYGPGGVVHMGAIAKLGRCNLITLTREPGPDAGTRRYALRPEGVLWLAQRRYRQRQRARRQSLEAR